MSDAEKMIKAYECSCKHFPNNRCEDCPYGYGHFDESGFYGSWWCDDDRLMEDMYKYIKKKEAVN